MKSNLVLLSVCAAFLCPSAAFSEAVAESDSTALVKVSGGSGSACYTSLEEAFDAVTSGPATLTLLQDATMTSDLVLQADLVLDGAGHTLSRDGSPMIAVADKTLTVTNIVLTGGTSRFIDVTGGALTLASGTTLSDVGGGGREMVAPIVVKGGTFTMTGGVTIRDCRNSFQRSSGGPLAAGAVVVDGSSQAAMAYLKASADDPSVITGCSGSGAGAVYIGNGAKLVIGGDVMMTGNTSIAGEASNLVVHDLSAVTIDAALGETNRSIGFTEGINASSNVVGEITASLSDSRKVATARVFSHDTNGDIGAAVVRNGKTLVVWSSAVSTDGVFTDTDGTTYELVKTTDLLTADKPAAVTGLVYTGKEQTGVTEGLAYEVTDGSATNAGTYTATVKLRAGYAWADGTTADVTLEWTIAKAVYDLSGVTFADKEFAHNGSPRKITIDSKTLPTGVSVSYAGNGQTGPGKFPVTATFTGDEENYEPIEPMTATMYIGVKKDQEIVTCEPFVFTAIEAQEDGSWKLTLAPGTTSCTYTLLTSDDLVTWKKAGAELTLESDETPFVFTVDGDEAKRFWKVTGADGVKAAGE